MNTYWTNSFLICFVAPQAFYPCWYLKSNFTEHISLPWMAWYVCIRVNKFPRISEFCPRTAVQQTAMRVRLDIYIYTYVYITSTPSHACHAVSRLRKEARGGVNTDRTFLETDAFTHKMTPIIRAYQDTQKREFIVILGDSKPLWDMT